MQIPKDYMQMPKSLTEYRNNLVDVAELGAMVALEKAGVLKPYISQAEAHKMYGRRVVERWIKEGLIKPIKDGNNSSKIRINRIQIAATAKVANRSTYLTMDERDKK